VRSRRSRTDSWLRRHCLPPSNWTYLPKSPTARIHYVRLVNGAFGYESFRHLGPALRGERIFPDKGFYEGLIYGSGIGGAQFSSAQHAGSIGPALVMAKRVQLDGRERLLDVGGGSGTYTLAFCAANPQLSATILDFAETIETAKRYAREAGFSARIAHLAGNAVATDWPAGHDVVLVSYLWSAVGAGDLPVLARRAADALPVGGLVLVHDFMVDNAREGPPFAAWYLLGSIFDNPDAVCLTPAYVEGVLRRAGFIVQPAEVMLPGITMLTRATKAH
jgi:2-hydroxy-4-(methylsulfanyl)butanoate S-methyltransferase